jgi:HK97 family phage major capsid protein
MTIEEIKVLGFEDLEKRSSEIAVETVDADSEKLEELNAELDAIEQRKNELNIEVEETRKKAAEVANGSGKEIEERKENKMTIKEVRNSKEYIDAYAKYIKTGKDAECRSLLSTNADDESEYPVVPVPEFVENRIREAWENDKIFSRVAKTYVAGNLKVGFELSSTGAAIHEEGADAPDEETLILGVVNMIPEMIKKWITVSDEVLALGSEAFLQYVYDEITYKIVEKAADIVVGKIQAAPTTATSSAVAVPQIAGPVSADTILDAIAELGDGARDLVLVASGQTIATLKKAALTGNYAYDPFFGLTVIQKSGMDGAIVGDLAGVQANLPEGDAVKFKFDDLSLAEKDLVKIVGRLYAAIEVVGPKMLVNITEDSTPSES